MDNVRYAPQGFGRLGTVNTLSQSGIYVIGLRGDNGRFYIGSAVNFLSRWRNHQSCLRRGKHHSEPLQRAWNKYGEAAFEFAVVEIVEEKTDLVAREQCWLDRYSPRYNSCRVAGSTLGRKHSAETREKMSSHPKSPDHKAKLAAAAMGNTRCVGRVVSQKQREKQAAARRGKKMSPEQLKKWHARVHTEETRAKIAAANRGRTHSPETRAKMAEARTRYYENKRKSAGQ